MNNKDNCNDYERFLNDNDWLATSQCQIGDKVYLSVITKTERNYFFEDGEFAYSESIEDNYLEEDYNFKADATVVKKAIEEIA